MKKQIVIIVMGGLILLGLGFSYGYFLGQKQTEERMAEITPLPRSPLIKDWLTVVSGKVVKVTPQSFTISYEGETIILSLSEKTKVKKLIATEDNGKFAKTIEEDLSLQDLREGDMVSVGVIADPQGNLYADIINISGKFPKDL